MKKSAFTLVELLVVVSLIAVLSGLALPVFSSVAQKGKLTNDLSNLRQLGLALQAYQNDNNEKMPLNQGGYFVVSAQATNQVLLNYTGSSFAVWHSSFDPRPVAPGDASPVSYSINESVLTPLADNPSSEGWTGDLAMSMVPLSQLLVASPSFSTVNGAVLWGDGGDNFANVASYVLTLPTKGQGMLQTTPTVQPSYYSRIPSLFADSHVELVSIANYQCTAANSANWVQWDPMNPNASANANTPATASNTASTSNPASMSSAASTSNTATASNPNPTPPPPPASTQAPTILSVKARQ